jgi:quercetin dioxygenase-like cupin family protein
MSFAPSAGRNVREAHHEPAPENPSFDDAVTRGGREERERDALCFSGRRLPPSFERRVVTITPGSTRPYDEAEWRDAIVIVERGEIEVEGRCGTRRRFRRGDILWLAGLPLRALHNHGDETALLLAIARRPA